MPTPSEKNPAKRPKSTTAKANGRASDVPIEDMDQPGFAVIMGWPFPGHDSSKAASEPTRPKKPPGTKS
jgi:hypothetical protein